MAGKSEDTKKKAVLLNDSDSDSENEKQKEVVEDDTGLLSLMNLNLGPKKKLLVLSLGVYKRSHCTEFMKFCLERFEVGIWSSAREWSMINSLDCIMVGLKSKMLFAWDQEQCTDSGFKTLENKHKPLFLKEMGKIWDKKYCNIPSRVGEFSASNTLLIDTNPYKALLNHPNTAVFPTDYKAYTVNDDALGPEGELRLYLEGLVDAEDVPSYVKDHSFGQPAITSMHPDWDFYSKVIRRHRQAED
ncbi:hypothetical protein EZV62_016185 [Acer yangbiense]|uniref:Mitochondrial import inner membrane translocase subunit TIM50 n=1 Tax=Acer yangbiense TaxID=1000413 RepID=A0A5C7HPV3_9ROSI|nr:hypothetical protein EZV62_016185 [Acer yangbiense]